MKDQFNQSRLVKFDAGELVKCSCNNYSKVGVVYGNSATGTCLIKFDRNSNPVECPESEVRGLTFKEFAWYRDPRTGKMKIGKSDAIIVLLSILMASIFIGVSVTVEGPWKLAPILIGVGIIVVNYIGLRYNYTRHWV